MTMSEPVLALIAALFGGAGLKVIEHLISRSSRKEDLAQQLRDELRQEVKTLRNQLDDIEQRLDRWKKKYYTLLVSFNELMAVAMNEGLVEEVNKIRRRMNESE